MLTRKDLRNAMLTGLWFMFLTFPLLVIKVHPAEKIVTWRWANLFWVGGLSSGLFLLLRLMQQQQYRYLEQIRCGQNRQPGLFRCLRLTPRMYRPLGLAATLLLLAFPCLFSPYQTNILTTALMYVVLGLGLNLVVGVAGLLNLGYAAFYAVGAYTYALLHLHFGLGFWVSLPLGGLLGALAGFLLGFPVLRLRGDYLAIVTLGFGEIIRLVLENWSTFSHGPSGISSIPRPSLFGLDLSLEASILYLYYLVLALVAGTLFAVHRLQASRIGRAWQAMKEDELACQAMGIDNTRLKLIAFTLGAAWAGMAGVIFAAKTTFVNPASFTFLESAIILCIVVLGGMGSIAGVFLGALLLILLPEYLRFLAEYRMLVFGLVLVLMMLFRPQGLLAPRRRKYTAHPTPWQN